MNLFIGARAQVNHFPKSFEITRKDLMYKNITKMQQKYGVVNFNFIPKTYIFPAEQQIFLEDAEKLKNQQQWWIIKPAANSQGRGISVTDKVSEVLRRQQGSGMVVSHYISNPLLIDGLKFDLRIYIVVTSVNPLKIYIYQDGLVRFATEPYNIQGENSKNR